MRLVSRQTKSSAVYQLKISLTGTRPPCWRRVLVPGGIRLDALHTVIQIVMGWDDSHLHRFAMDGNRWSLPDPDPDEARYSKELDERAFRLHEVLTRVGASLEYLYDFGDEWRHKVALEKILPAAGGPRRPTCVGGSKPVPPEDDDDDEEEYEGGYTYTVAGVDALLAQEKWSADSMG